MRGYSRDVGGRERERWGEGVELQQGHGEKGVGKGEIEGAGLQREGRGSGHLDHECGGVRLQVVIAADAGEDLSRDGEGCVLCRHEGADLSHDLKQGNLAQVGRLAAL